MAKEDKKEESATPDRTLKINYKGAEHELTFPNTGQLMDLAIMKADLSKGTYNIISNTSIMGDKLAQFSLDTIVHLTVLCPDLIKGLNIQTYSEMEVIDMKALIKIYIEEVLPWMNSWYRLLNDIGAD